MAASRTRWNTAKALLVLALLLGACGGDGDGGSSEDAEGDSSASGGEAADGLGSTVDDDDLLVSRDYLQGVWCNDEGTTVTVDGDTVTLADSTGAGIELVVDVLFLDTPDSELISQSDDEFVLVVEGDEVTFVRGAC